MFNRESAIRLLLRGPGALNSPVARWTVFVLAGTGAGFLVWSGVIHLMLWSDGYKDVATIGPLFLVQGIAGIVIALAIVALRRLVLLIVGAGTGVATAGGLLISVNFGLFGLKESLATTYATLSLAVEFTAAFVLLVAACVLAFSSSARVTSNSSPVPTRT
jgi:hypothetical protein